MRFASYLFAGMPGVFFCSATPIANEVGKRPVNAGSTASCDVGGTDGERTVFATSNEPLDARFTVRSNPKAYAAKLEALREFYDKSMYKSPTGEWHTSFSRRRKGLFSFSLPGRNRREGGMSFDVLGSSTRARHG